MSTNEEDGETSVAEGFDLTPHIPPEGYVDSQGDKGVVMEEIIVEWREMMLALGRRSKQRLERGGNLVKYDPAKGQGRVLMVLGKEGSSNQAELASQLDVTPQTLGTALRKMESQGLVKRERDEVDRRAINVSLTEKGLKARNALEEENRYSGSMFECFSAEELQVFYSMICRLKTHLEKEYQAAQAYDSYLEQ